MELSDRAIDEDPLTDRSAPDVLWTRVNTAEAVPGVLKPAGWAFYGRLAETGVRVGFADLGVIPRWATAYPDTPTQRFLGVFHGRYAINVGVFRNLMTGFPGVSGDDAERDVLGSVRPGVQDTGFGRRVPAVVAKAPARLLTAGRDSARVRARTGSWWSASVGPDGPRVDPRELLVESMDRFAAAVRLQGRNRILYQGVCSQLVSLAERAGDHELAVPLLAAAGDIEETAVSDDLWSVARGSATLEWFVARHGYHAPNVGDIASRSWREDAAPIRRLLDVARRGEQRHSELVIAGPLGE